MRKLILITILMLLFVPQAIAQEGETDAPLESPTGVWVTTQDNSNLRIGPGAHFEVLGVVPHTMTIPAVGRTADARWVQVTYEEQTGWIASWLLVWTGDFAGLNIDGVNPVSYVRRTGVVAETVRETPIYANEIHPADQVGTLPEDTIVEVTAMLGTKNYRGVQIVYEGQLYWVGSWNIRVISGWLGNAFDISYIYAFGRLLIHIEKDIDDGEARLRQIDRIWLDLQSGYSISCNRIPAYLGHRRVPDSDVEQEKAFIPVVTALDTARGHTNSAISLLEDICNRGEPYITMQDIQDGLDEVNSARRNYNLSRSVLWSLRTRDPNTG
jgi:hypothetical protein